MTLDNNVQQHNLINFYLTFNIDFTNFSFFLCSFVVWPLFCEFIHPVSLDKF